MKYNTKLNRKRIINELDKAMDYPLSLVVAPMGYGKTTVVEAFFAARTIEAVWFNFEMPESSPSYIWDTLSRQLKNTNSDLGVMFGTMGFPYTTPQRNQIIQLIESISTSKELFIVIDDYQFNRSGEIDEFIKLLIKANVKGLKLLLLSRTTPELDVTELQLKNKCYKITEKFFELTVSEVGKLYRLHKVSADNNIIEKTYELSEGWISAVLLLIQRYKETDAIDSLEDIEGLIATTLMKKYDPYIKEIAVLGIIDSFSSEQLSWILGDDIAAVLIAKLIKKGAFIRYNPKSKRYAIHNIFTKYLYKNHFLDLDKDQQAIYFKRTGEWFSKNAYMMEAIRCFLEAREYERILQEFEKKSVNKIFDYYPQFVNKIMEQIPEDLIYKYPIAYISYLHFLITAHDIKLGINKLIDLENYIDRHKDNKLFDELNIQGEIEFLKGLTSYNELNIMFAHQKRAYEIIQGPSLATRPDKMPCAGSYSVLYLYHKEIGAMKSKAEKIRENMIYYDHLSDRLGTGVDSLVMSEYMLEIGDIPQAELYAQKALIKSKQLPQFDVIINSSYVLARCLLAKGEIQGAMEIMNQLSRDSSYELTALFHSVRSPYTYAMDSMSLKTDHLENLSEALKSRDLDNKMLFFQSRGLAYILYGQYLLQQKKYLELEVFCEEMQAVFQPFNNLIGFLNAYILESIAAYNLYGIEKATTILNKALSLGRNDLIITSIAEYGCDLLPILKEAYEIEEGMGESALEAYVMKIYHRTTAYAKNATCYNDSERRIVLTSREKDIMNLLSTGQKNIEIAKTLYISESAVKKMLSSIYRKFNVKNRTAAIKYYEESLIK